MACCGQRRALALTNGRLAEANHRPRPVPPSALYEYTGATGMTVVGPISGRTYRFAQPGARVQVDARDIPSMTGLPNLRLLR
jgi:hypothetical protein